MNAEQIVTELPTAGYLILEGADAVGKTTIARTCCQRWSWTYRHNPYDVDTKDLYAKYWAELSGCHNTCVDRSFLSEWVYGTVVRGHSRLTLDQCRLLAAHASAHGGVLVGLLATTQTVLARLAERGDTAADVVRVGALLKAYEAGFDELREVTRVVIFSTDSAPEEAGDE